MMSATVIIKRCSLLEHIRTFAVRHCSNNSRSSTPNLQKKPENSEAEQSAEVVASSIEIIKSQKSEIAASSNEIIKSQKPSNEIAEDDEFPKLPGELGLKPPVIWPLRSVRMPQEDIYKPEPNDIYLYGTYKSWDEAFEVVRKRKKVSFLLRYPFNADYYGLVQQIHDWSFVYLVRKFLSIPERQDIYHQRFLPKRQEVLGPDMAAAHFITNRMGAVKLVGNSEWISKEKGNIKILPGHRVYGLQLEKLDASGTGLRPEGLLNISKLRSLKWLNISGLHHMDNWCLDFFSQQYGSQLEYFDISHCKNITHKGLSCMYRFEKLQVLRVEGLTECNPEFRLALLMLSDIMPNLRIEGLTLGDVEELKLLDDKKELKLLDDKKELKSTGSK